MADDDDWTKCSKHMLTYRGDWCPECQKERTTLTEDLDRAQFGRVLHKRPPKSGIVERLRLSSRGLDQDAAAEIERLRNELGDGDYWKVRENIVRAATIEKCLRIIRDWQERNELDVGGLILAIQALAKPNPQSEPKRSP